MTTTTDERIAKRIAEGKAYRDQLISQLKTMNPESQKAKDRRREIKLTQNFLQWLENHAG
jgi:hypothetical protein